VFKISCLIVAAGKGTRSGLSYPKTLFTLQGKPIIILILEKLIIYDSNPTIIVSPSGIDLIKNTLDYYSFNCNLVLQYQPLGMGDAVLQFENSSNFNNNEHILLQWGDIPFIQPATISFMIKTHFINNNDFTLITGCTDSAYTKIIRNQIGSVTSIIESREHNNIIPSSGERDIGLFIFNKNIVFDILKIECKEKYGYITKEHGFLYVIEKLVRLGLKVEALNIATNLDFISFNSLEDVKHYL